MAGRVTLEISSDAVRLMETDGGRVVRWSSRSLEPGIFEEGVISNPQALSAAVKQLMTSSSVRARNAIASVSGLYSLSRIVMVANPAGASVSQHMVLDAAREVMPFSEDELYLSWQPIATVGEGQQVMVVSVPRDVIDSEVQALRAAGVNPRILELKAMALARAVNREQALILNIEPASFDTVAVINGVAEIMRTTAWQPDELSLDDKAEYLAVALEMVVGFYNSHHPGFSLTPTIPLFITGQMSGDNALTEKLQARVEYPIEPLAPPLEYPAHLPVSQYAVNIGLALKGSASSKSLGQGSYLPVDMNLLPQIYRPWKPSARQIYFFFAIVAAIALLFPLYNVTSVAMEKTATLKTRYDIINSELQRRQLELSKREPLQKAITEYKTIMDMGGGFVEDLNVIVDKAKESGIKLESISHEGSSITISCRSDSYLIFRDYLSALEKSGRFSSISRPPEQYGYVKGGTIKLKPKLSQ